MSLSNTKCTLILALDVSTKEEALSILKTIGAELKWVKIGLQLFTRYGPEIVNEISGLGYKIFLDLKLHDIPNTVASAVKSLSILPIHLLSIHASGGREMMRKAHEASKSSNPNLKLTGISVLTSMNEGELEEIGIKDQPQDQVQRLAKLAIKENITTLVCSPLELPILRKILGPEIALITPGIRPMGTESGDQKRIMTPSEAAKLGASFIVVGRPILLASSPKIAVEEILKEIQ